MILFPLGGRAISLSTRKNNYVFLWHFPDFSNRHPSRSEQRPGRPPCTLHEAICERNGSEHGRDHGFKYREPTQDELLEALKDLEEWIRATEEHNAARREHAQQILPRVKAKLAVLLTA